MATASKFITVLALAAALLAGCEDERDKYIGFAQCLTEKGVAMYGAYWCPHCANQKEVFGPNAFKYVTYIECDKRGANAQPELCAKKNVEGYPTWEFADGGKIASELSALQLSKRSGCPLPLENAAGTSTQ